MRRRSRPPCADLAPWFASERQRSVSWRGWQRLRVAVAVQAHEGPLPPRAVRGDDCWASGASHRTQWLWRYVPMINAGEVEITRQGLVARCRCQLHACVALCTSPSSALPRSSRRLARCSECPTDRSACSRAMRECSASCPTWWQWHRRCTAQDLLVAGVRRVRVSVEVGMRVSVTRPCAGVAHSRD